MNTEIGEPCRGGSEDLDRVMPYNLPTAQAHKNLDNVPEEL